MLKCATSLWSADLANLAESIRRVEPFSDRFHIDVADGHYTPTLLFFPDLVQAARRHTALPFEVHLMTTHPLLWLDPFIEAGADTFIVHTDTEQGAGEIIEAIKQRGRKAGIALKLAQELREIESYLPDLDVLTMLGTEMGIKGVGLDGRAPDRIRAAQALIRSRGASTEVQADGGIRRQTVPALREAGADSIVPGTLMFGGDPAELHAWLKTLG